MLCLAGAIIATAYLWAVVFGDGVHGLKDTVALNKSSSFPDANVAFIAAVAVYFLSTMTAIWFSDIYVKRTALAGWVAWTTLAGGGLFALSRILM
jgi:hypothetical protein